MEAPLHWQLPRRRGQNRRNAGQPPPQVFRRRPRQKGAEERFGVKHPFLLALGSSAHKGLRALAAGSLGTPCASGSPLSNTGGSAGALENTMGLCSGNWMLLVGYCYCCFTLLPFLLELKVLLREASNTQTRLIWIGSFQPRSSNSIQFHDCFPARRYTWQTSSVCGILMHRDAI